MQRNNFLRILLISLVVMTSMPSWANEKQDLQKIEADIERSKEKAQELERQSRTVQQELDALRTRLISLSQSVQDREETVTRLEDELAIIAEDEKTARTRLEKQYAQSIETLMAMQRLALNPPEAIIALPQEPGDMVRSAILLRSMVPQIQAKADVLKADLETYSEKREKLETQKAAFDGASESLADEKLKLRGLIEDKKALRKRFARDRQTENRRLARLTKQAKNLQGLIQSLENEKKRTRKVERSNPKPALEQPVSEADIALGKPTRNTKPISKSKGNLFRPAIGPVVMKFGQREKLGGKHKGISIKARRGARVVATYDGEIAFAGPFRGYRQLLIIDHGAGYHTLLTGMERIDVSVGQRLITGEPVGIMSEDRVNNEPLYFELRKNGTPINPLPWIRQRNAKATG